MIRIFDSIRHSHTARILAACLLFAGASAGAWGTNYYWISNNGSNSVTSGNWASSSSWSTSGDNSTANTGSYPVAGDTVYFTGRGNAVTVNLTADAYASTVYFNTTGYYKVTINLNGYSLTDSGYLYLVGSNTSTDSHSSNVIVNGSGSITMQSLDTTNDSSHTLTIAGGVVMTVEATLYGNLNSGCTFTIKDVDGSCTLYVPASGVNINYGDSSIVYSPSDLPQPYGDPSIYTISSDNTSLVTGNSGSGMGLTFKKPGAGDSTQTVPFNYSVQVISTHGSTCTYTLNGTSISDESEGSIDYAGNASGDIKYLKASALPNTGDGIIITFRTPDDSMDLAEIRYIQDEVMWIGGASGATTDWNTDSNWNTGSVPTSGDVIIPSGCSYYPSVNSGVSASLKSVTIKNNAKITMNGGSLTVTSLKAEDLGKITGTSGTVTFTGSTASWEATNPSYSEFPNVTIASGSTFTPQSDMYITGNFTNSAGGTFDAQSKSIKIVFEPSGTSAAVTGSSYFTKTLFDTLFCTGQGGKTLAFLGNVTVENLILKGSSASSLLSVTGNSATAQIKLSSSQSSGMYLSLNNTTAPKITNGTTVGDVTYTVYSSTGPSTWPAASEWGWVKGDASEYVWLGVTSSWTNGSNWSTGNYPGSIAGSNPTVKILSGLSAYPVLTGDEDVGTGGSITIASGAFLDFAGYKVTAGTFTNNGKIRLKGTETLSNITTYTGSSGSLEYYGTATSINSKLGTTFKNISVTSTGNLTVSSIIAVTGSITNAGTFTSTSTTITISGNITNTGTLSGGVVTITPSGTSIITGTSTASATSFSSLSCTGQGGKELDIEKYISVTGSDGSLVLTGTAVAAASRLKIDGSGSITLSASQTTTSNFMYLTIENVPIENYSSYTCDIYDTTCFSSTTPSGWITPTSTSTYTWTGTSSTVWSLAGNWTVGGSTATTIPSDNDDVVLPSSGVSNEPALSGAVTVNSITIASGRTLTLGGYNFTVSSSWTNKGTVTATGAGTISLPSSASDIDEEGTWQYIDGSSGTICTGLTYNNLKVAVSSGTSCSVSTGASLKVGGTLSIDSSSTLTLGGACTAKTITNNGIFNAKTYDLSASGTFTNNGTVMFAGTQSVSIGTITNGTGTVQYTGSSATLVWGTSYNNLIIDDNDTRDGTSTAKLTTDTSGITVSGSLTNDGTLTTGAGTISVTGAVTNYGKIDIASSGSITVGSLTQGSAGVVDISGSGSINKSYSTAGTFIYSEAAASSRTISALDGYYDMTIEGGGSWTTSSDISVGKDLSVSGTGTSASFGGGLSVTGNFSTANTDTASVSFNNTSGSAEATTFTGTATFGSSGNVSFGNYSGDSFTVNGGGIDLSSVTGTITFAGTITVKSGNSITFKKDAVLAANTVFASDVALGGSAGISFTNAVSTAKSVTFNSTFTGNTSGNVSFGATGYPVNVIFGDGSGTDTVSDIAALTVNGTTEIKSGTTITTTGKQTYTAAVTNTGTINVPDVTTGSTGVEFGASYTGTGGTLTGITGTNNPYIDFTNSSTTAVTMETFTANGDIVRFNGSATITFTPGNSNTYAEIQIDKSAGTFTAQTNTLSVTTLTITADTGCTFNTAVTCTNLFETAATGALAFAGGISVTDTTSPVTLSTAGTVTFGTDSSFAGGITHTVGETDIAGTISATDKAVSLGTVALTGTSEITTGSSSGSVTIGGAVTDSGTASNLTITSPTIALNGGTVTTTGNQLYTGVVTSSAATGLTLSANSGSGTITLDSASVTTTGTSKAQTYVGNVLITNTGTTSFIAGTDTVTFDGTLDGGGYNVTIGDGSNATNVVFGDGSGTDTVSDIAALTVNGTTEIKSNASITTSGKQIYTGDITNTGTINVPAVATGNTAVEFGAGYTGTGGTLTGNSGTNPYIDFTNSSTAAVTMGTFTANGDIVRCNGSAAVTFTPGSSTYAGVEVDDTAGVTLGGGLTASSVTIGTSVVLTAGANATDAYTISLSGNWTDNNTSGGFTARNSTVKFTDSATITGSTSFYNLTCSGAGGKTLTISGSITVETIDLSGSGTSSLLTVNSNTAADTIVLTNSNTTAQYLSIGGISGSMGFGPKISTGTITASSSKCYTSSGYLPSGWTFGTYTWLSTAETTAWGTASNWDNNAVPYTSSDVVEIPASSNNPVYSSSDATTIKSLSLTAAGSQLTVSGSGNIHLAAGSSPLANTGTIKYESTGRITDTGSTPAFINDVSKGTVEYAGSGGTITEYVSGTTSSDYDYYNLTLSGSGTFGNSGVTIVVKNTFTSGSSSVVDSLASLIVNGASSIGGNITTTGTQTYSGTVTLSSGSGLTLTAYGTSAATVTFGGTLTGNGNSLTFGSGSAPTNAVFGNTVKTIDALTVSGTTTVNTSSVTTTGIQTYSGAVTLGAGSAESFTGTTMTFNSSLTGDSKDVSFVGDVVFGDGSGTDTVSGIAALTVNGTTEIKSGGIITTSGVQTYTGDVTNYGTINVPAIATGFTAVSFMSAYTGDSGSSLAGSTTTNPYIDFYGDVTFDSSSTTFTPNGDVVRFYGTGNQTFVPGSANTYDSVSVTNSGGTISIADGNTFIQDTTTAGTYTFAVATGAKVTVGTGKFVVDTLSVTSTGTFTQAGANASGTAALQSVLNITGTGSVTWDSGIDGGYLTLGGCSSTGTVVFNHKNVTVTGSPSLNGVVFYDLYIPDEVTVTNGGTITVIRNFMLSDDDSDSYNGTYTPGSGILYLGGMASSGIASADGTVTDNSTTVQSLGTVVINGNSQTAVKTAATALKIDSLTVTAGTLDLAADNAVLTVTGTTINNGTITGSGSASSPAAITFTGKYSGSGTLTATKGTTYFKSDADLSGTTFTANGGTVEFDGSSGQTLTINTSSGTTFSTLDVTTTGGVFSVSDDSVKTLTVDTVTVNTTQNVTFGSAVQTSSSGTTKKVTITNTGTVLFKQAVNVDSLVLKKTGETIFEGAVTAGTLTDASEAGNITFNGNISVTTLTGGVFKTTGTVTLGNDGSSADTASFTNGISHTSGDTVLACALTTTDAVVTFGSATGPKTVTVNKDSSITSGTGAIMLNGTTTFAGSYTLTLGSTSVANTISIGTVTTTSGTSTLALNNYTGGSVSFADGGSVSIGALTVTSGSYDITIDSATFDVTGTSLSTAFNNTGILTLGNDDADVCTFTGGMTNIDSTDHNRQTNLTGLVKTTATGASAVLDNLVLVGTASINTDTGNGNITINGTITNTTSQALTLDAGTGSITVGGTVGSGTALSSLSATGAAINLNGASVTTTGTQNYTGDISSTSASGITFDAGTYDITIAGGSSPTTVTTTGEQIWNSPVVSTNTSGITFTAASGSGTIDINGGKVTSNGNQIFTGNVILSTNTTMKANSGTVAAFITFNGTVNSSTGNHFILKIGSSSDTADVSNGTFGNETTDTVGTADSLVSLTVYGTTKINTTSVTTAGSQTYTGIVTLGTGTTLTTTDSAISFGSTVAASSDNSQLLTVNAGSGKVTFTGAVGTAAVRLSSLSVTSSSSAPDAVAVNGGAVYTAGGQTYTGNVSCGNSSGTVFYANDGSSAAAVTFKGTLAPSTAGYNLAVGTGSAAAGAVFEKNVGATKFGTIDVYGTAQFGTGGTGITVASTGAQTYYGAATLGGGTTFTANSGSAALVTFKKALDSDGGTARSVSFGTGTTASQQIKAEFDADVGTTYALSSIDIYGTTQFGTGGSGITVASTGTQTYYGAATLAGDTLFMANSGSAAASVTFEDTLDSYDSTARALTFGTGTAASQQTDAEFDAGVGQTHKLGTVTIYTDAYTVAGTGVSFADAADFKQNTSSDFAVKSGAVKVGTGSFVAGSMTLADGSTFTQTGINTGEQYAQSITLSGTAKMDWDKDNEGGTLTVYENISGSSSGTLNFHHKNVTYGNSILSYVTLRDLVVQSGESVTLAGPVRVRRDVCIEDGGTYTNGGQTLYLGNSSTATGVWSTSSDGDSEDGSIYDRNMTPNELQNLGTVVVNQGITTKIFGANTASDNHLSENVTDASCRMTTLDLDDTSASAGTITLNNAAVTTLNNAVSTSFDVGIDTLSGPQSSSVTSAVTFKTTGTVTLGSGGSSTDSASFTDGITHTTGNTVFACALTTTNAAVAFGNPADSKTVTVNKLSSITTGGTGSGAVTLNGTLALGDGLSVNSGSDSILIGAAINFTGDTTLALTNSGSADLTINGDITTASDGQGTITVNSGSGAVSFSGNVGTSGKKIKAVTFTKAGGTVSFAGSKTVYCGTLTTGSGAGVTFGDDSTVSLTTLSVTSGSYDITVNSTAFDVTGSSSTTFNNTGTLTLGNGTGDTCTFAAGITNTDGSTGRQTNLIGSLETTAANASVGLDNLVLTGTALIDTSAGNGAITINGTVTDSTTQALTLNAGTGSILCTGTIGSGTALSSLTVTNSGVLTFSSSIHVSGALTQTTAATGTTTFAGPVTAGSVMLQGTDVAIRNTVTATGSVSVTNSGALTIADVTDTASDTTDTTHTDITAPGGFSQTSGGSSAAVSIAGDISTTGTPLSFASPLTLTGDVLLSSSGGSVTLTSSTNASSVDTEGLEISSGSGSISFGAVGSTKRLKYFYLNTTQTGELSVPEVQAVTVEITTGGPVVQTAAVSGTDLYIKTLSTGTGHITLENSGNDFDNVLFAALNTAGTAASSADISYTDADGFNFADASAVQPAAFLPALTAAADRTAGLVTGGTATLTCGAAVTQSGQVIGGSVRLLGTGPYTLTNTLNRITAVAASVTGTLTLTNASALSVTSVATPAPGTTGTTDGITAASFTLNNTGTVSCDEPVTVSGGTVVLNSTGTTTLNSAADITDTSSGGTVSFGASEYTGALSTAADITTNGGTVTFINPVTLTGTSVTYSTNGSTSDTSLGGNIAFNSTLTGTTAGNNVLTLTAGTGSVTFAGAAGSTQLGTLTVSGTGGITADSSVSASSVTLTGGDVTLTGAVTAPGGFKSTGAVFTSGPAATITTTDTALTINHTGPVTAGAALSSGAGAGDVTISSSGGTVTLSGAVTSGTGKIDIDSVSTLSITNTLATTTGNVTIDSAGTAVLGSGADITTTTGNVTFGADKTGTLSTAGDITTASTGDNGNIIFTHAVTLTGDIVITNGGTVSGTGGILFSSTLNGGYALALTAGSGNIEFAGAAGSADVPLGAVTINSAYNVAGDNVSAGNPLADAGTIYAESLTQNTGTGTTRLGAVTLTGVMSLTAAGVGIIGDSTITASSVTLTGGSVDLNGTVTAPSGFSSTGTTFDNTGAAVTTTDTALTINHTGAVIIGAALSSGTGKIDIDSGNTLTVSAPLAATTGNVTVDSTGTATLDSAADITTTTGTVTFGASKAGTLSTAGDITTSGVTADGSGSVTFTRAVTLTGGVVITTDNSSSTGGFLTFGSSLDSDAAASERALTIDAGTGAVTFTGAAGGTIPLASLTLTNSGVLTFTNALSIAGALTQTNAATGAAVFGGSTATAAATSVGSADLNGTSYTLYGTFTVTSGSMSVTNSGLFLTEPDADIDLTSGSFTQDGGGLNQLAGGITTHDSGVVTFATDVYLYGSDVSMQLGGGGAVTVGPSGTKNLHIAASTASKIITIGSPLTAENIVLYGGTLSPGADITANADLVLLNGNTDTMYKDNAAGLTTLYAYNTAASPSRSGTASPSVASFPAKYPDGTDFIDGSSAAYCGAVSSLTGRTLTAKQNFYDDGVDLTGNSAWTLRLKDNSTASDAFAEAYNCTIAYCTVTCTASDGSAWVAAAEGCTNGGNNTDETNSTTNGIAFSRPLILVNNTAVARDISGTANLSGTYTVYDDVIRVEFVDSVTGASLKIENSRNEITKAVSHMQYYNGSSVVSFTGTYTDADCTKSTGVKDDGSDSAGDVSVFYIKAGTTWNTDATGISAGQEETTDGSIHYDAGTDRSGTHKSSIPYLNLPKALSVVYATLRDCHKNRIGNYDGAPSSNDYDMDGDGVNDANTSASAGRFTAVSDRAAPVLIAAYTGQETHTAYNSAAGASSQPYYDAHNFIELQYSEAVNIGDLTYNGGAENEQAQTAFASASEHGGAVINNGSSDASGITVTGLASAVSGYVVTGKRGSTGSDTTVSALYRMFSLTAGGTDVAQADRIRVSIAGYVDGTVTVNGSSYRNWTGYIDSATVPSGTVTSIANSYITDRAGILIDDSASAAGTTNHKLNTLTISSTETELYGTWDTSAPVFAPFRSVVAQNLWSSYSTAPENYEAIGNTATGSTNSMLDRIEFHLYDNTPSYSTDDSYAWFSRRGWCDNDLSAVLYKTYSYAADLFGGSRPFDDTPAARTTGGIRYSSVYESASAFKYAVGSNVTPVNSFDTSAAVTGGAAGAIFRTTTDTYNSTGDVDSLYFAVYLSDTTLARKSRFTVSYDADTGFVTDLAGNRLKSATINTIDLTPPEFNMTISPVGNNFLYVVFSKKLNLDELLWIDDDGTHKSYTDPLSLIPKSLELVDTSTGSPSTGIAIDEDTPAVKVFQNDYYTGLIFKLKRSTGSADEGNVRLSDIENVYVRIKNRGTSTDPVTGLSGTYVSYIQDSIGNSMPLFNAHAFSDFAVNVVNPQYAYNVDADSNISDVISSYHSDSSWSVHDWSADQNNYGTLMLNEGVLVHAGLADGTSDNSDGLPVNVTAYFDPKPDSSAVSVTYNSNTSQSWRIWLPGGTDDIFEALAPANDPPSNKGFASAAGVSGDEDKTYMNFTLSADSLSSKNWKAGDQVKFLFGLVDASGNPVKIRHVPVFNGDSTGGTYSGTEYPLFALRLTQSLSNSDSLEAAGKKIASSLDLWSFRLKALVSQRGGVTILNNVINASTGETTVVKVTMPSDGSLSVVVMTLDGDIVQYLQHGTTSSGDHYYKWNGTTKSGKRVARGMYFIRVFGTGIDETRKVLVVKD